MKIKILLLLLFLIPLRMMALTGYNYGDTLTNMALSGLKIRSEPGGSNVVGKVPYGGKVIVCAKPWGFADELLPYETEGIKGGWVKIKFENISGFVFDGFLSTLPAPLMKHRSLKEYADACFTRCGKKSAWFHDSEGLSLTDSVGFYLYKGNYLVLEERYGYEEYNETLTIQCVSAEESYLIARNIYKYEIDTLISNLRNHPEKTGISSQADIEKKILEITTFYFKDGKYEWVLADDGCFDIITVVQLSSNIFKIMRSMGC